jgi:hypothetical protein
MFVLHAHEDIRHAGILELKFAGFFMDQATYDLFKKTVPFVNESPVKPIDFEQSFCSVDCHLFMWAGFTPTLVMGAALKMRTGWQVDDKITWTIDGDGTLALWRL